MSLLGLSSLFPRARPDEHRSPAPGAGDVAVEDGHAEVVYLLVYNSTDHPAGGDGLGWTLIARHRTGWSWTSLATRGANAHAGPQIAKAVAVRVLSQHGVIVAGCSDHQPRDRDRAGGGDQAGDIAVSRARLTPPAAATHQRQPPRQPRRPCRCGPSCPASCTATDNPRERTHP